jgi:iron complex transport system substrate-binding protein
MKRATLGVLLSVAAMTLPMRALASERWIVANSYVAEIVVALGAADQVVGVGGGTEHIAELRNVPRLPGFRQTSAEPLLALAPQRVLMTDEWVVPVTIAQLRAAGVQVELLDGEQSEAGVERRIRTVAALLGRVSAGEALVARFRREMAESRRFVAKAVRQPRVIFILAGGSRPTLVGGRGTNAAQLIELAGGRNVAAQIEGFRTMSQESMIEAAPEIIVTNLDGMARSGTGEPVALRAPGAALTPAGRSGRLVTVPGEFLQGMGILTPEGVRKLAIQLHPELR